MPFDFAYTEQFEKQAQKLPINLKQKLKRQLNHLEQNIRHPSLKAKKMVGKAGIWEARVDFHYRFTFQVEGATIILRSVGTHQIYRQP
jgi:mRNA-degrading endonuclease RelE of RelBE toxin-antitoxin system